MTIKLTEHSHIVLMAYFDFESPGGRRGNWMGCVSHEVGAATAEFVYRFRYYNDAQAFDSNDEKSWFKLEGPVTSDDDMFEKFASGIHIMFEGYAGRGPHSEIACLGGRAWDLDIVRVSGGLEKMAKACEGKKWMHTKVQNRDGSGPS